MHFHETIGPSNALKEYMERIHTAGMQMPIPDFEALRHEAMFAGALDPMTLRFQIVEYDKTSGERLSVPCNDIGFQEAILTTAGLIQKRQDSHFCLEPVGFIQ